MKLINDWKLLVLFSLTLGLAPFVPEPHLWGKIKWIAGGAVGMKPMDWFDFVQHGLPFILLGILGIIKLVQQLKKQTS
jgi:hypothetical protein